MIIKYFLAGFYDSNNPLFVPAPDIEFAEQYVKKLYPNMSSDDYYIEEIGEQEADGFGRPINSKGIS